MYSELCGCKQPPVKRPVLGSSPREYVMARWSSWEGTGLQPRIGRFDSDASLSSFKDVGSRSGLITCGATALHTPSRPARPCPPTPPGGEVWRWRLLRVAYPGAPDYPVTASIRGLIAVSTGRPHRLAVGLLVLSQETSVRIRVGSLKHAARSAPSSKGKDAGFSIRQSEFESLRGHFIGT